MKRRKFLKNSSSAVLGSALSSAAVSSTLLNLKLMSNAVAQTTSSHQDYKALVCVMLAGGNDSFNMLVPTTGGDNAGTEYRNYQNVRGNLALDLSELLQLNIQGAAGRKFGLHGSMPKFRDRVKDGNATFVANLGSLVERVTAQEVRDNTASRLPRGLFSHNDQQTTWQTALASANSKTGWGGRLADQLLSANVSNDVSMNISLSGNQKFLLGNSTISYAIGPDGATVLTGTGNLNYIPNKERVGKAREIVDVNTETPAKHFLVNAFAQTKSESYDKAEKFSADFNNQTISTPFDDSSLDKDLKAVAKTIAAADGFELKRQVFFVQIGGFDHHNGLLAGHANRLTELDNALDSFWRSMEELGLEDKVTTFTASDFGRTLQSNGQGSDHAWGGNAMVMGGAVKQRLMADNVQNGSRIYGDYPTDSEFQKGSGLDSGASGGRLVPTTSIDEYFAELALWFGLEKSQLEDVIPNIRSFYNPASSENPIGFLPSQS